MSRDYKNLRNNKKSDPEIKNASNLFIFLIGLVLGVFITSTIFFNHFNKIYNGESTLAITDKDDIKKKNNNDKITNTEIIFDFPTILEERQVTEIPKKEYKKIIDANEDKSRTIYILQVGSFKNFKSADALEAKLAFLGLSAYIDKKNIIDKGIIYRVYVGPFEDKEKLNEIKIKLSENNVSSIVSIEQKIENKSM